MSEFQSTESQPIPSGPPNWLIFVEKADDDGPWLRMMVSNPFNGAMCPLLNAPVEPSDGLLKIKN